MWGGGCADVLILVVAFAGVVGVRTQRRVLVGAIGGCTAVAGAVDEEADVLHHHGGPRDTVDLAVQILVQVANRLPHCIYSSLLIHGNYVRLQSPAQTLIHSYFKLLESHFIKLSHSSVH